MSNYSSILIKANNHLLHDFSFQDNLQESTKRSIDLKNKINQNLNLVDKSILIEIINEYYVQNLKIRIEASEYKKKYQISMKENQQLKAVNKKYEEQIDEFEKIEKNNESSSMNFQNKNNKNWENKFKQLSKYINEFICQTNSIQDQYLKNYKQLKQENQFLKCKNSEIINQKKQIQILYNQIKDKYQKNITETTTIKNKQRKQLAQIQNNTTNIFQLNCKCKDSSFIKKLQQENKFLSAELQNKNKQIEEHKCSNSNKQSILQNSQLEIKRVRIKQSQQWINKLQKLKNQNQILRAQLEFYYTLCQVDPKDKQINKSRITQNRDIDQNVQSQVTKKKESFLTESSTSMKSCSQKSIKKLPLLKLQMSEYNPFRH